MHHSRETRRRRCLCLLKFCYPGLQLSTSTWNGMGISDRRRVCKKCPNEFIRIRQLYLDPRLDITFAYNLRICRQPFLLLFTQSCPVPSCPSWRSTTRIHSSAVWLLQRVLGKRVSQLNTLLLLLLPPSHIISFITRQGVPSNKFRVGEYNYI